MRQKTVYLAGHQGMVGSALKQQLSQINHIQLITQTHDQLDLINQADVNAFFEKNKIDEVYLAAAKVGGIYANNTYPADFIYQNLMIETNIIQAAHQHNVNKLLFLGSSCIYPKQAPQPIPEDALLTGALEATNEPYAIAKIAGIKLCESYNRQYGRDYRSVMPTNLYGPNDNFHPKNAHVIPALLQRFYQAKQNNDPAVVIWGSGKVRREFLHVDDMAKACLYIMNLTATDYQKQTSPLLSHLNIGSGIDISIETLAKMIKHISQFQGKLVFDTSQPDGPQRKLLAVNRLNQLGWHAEIPFDEGLKQTYHWFLNNQNRIKTV